MMKQLPERWLRGPLPGVSPYLQPVAHALLQAVDEVERALETYPEELLWTRPAGVASVGFHLQHLDGVIDRLFTYVRGQPLSSDQLDALSTEGAPRPGDATVPELVDNFRRRVGLAIEQLRATDAATLPDHRAVGRAGLPSTHLGLLFHAAEHTQRHVGQILVTARVQTEGNETAG